MEAKHRDTEILALLRERKEAGMTALFERYYKPLVVFAGSYVRDVQEAEDLVQEQMVKLWEKGVFAQVEAGALSSFLFTVVKHACINWLERRRLDCLPLSAEHFRIAQEEAERLDEEAVAAIRQALGMLPEKTRRVVNGVMLEEKMYKEVAEELGVSLNTVKTLLRLGIRELRELLKGKEGLFMLLSMRFREEWGE